MSIHRFSLHDLVERVSERIFPQDADGERRMFICECRWRPFHEFCEVEQERCFYLVFQGLLLRGAGHVAAPGEYEGQEQHQRQGILPHALESPSD